MNYATSLLASWMVAVFMYGIAAGFALRDSTWFCVLVICTKRWMECCSFRHNLVGILCCSKVQ